MGARLTNRERGEFIHISVGSLYHMYFSVYFVLYTTIILVCTMYKIDYFCPGLLSKYLAMFRSHDDLQSVVYFPWKTKLLEMKAGLKVR